MNGHEEFWPDQVKQQFHFLGTGVARNMHCRESFVNHFCSTAQETVDGLVYGFFITRDGVRGNDNGVAHFDVELAVGAGGKTPDNGCRFTLGTGAHQHHLVFRQVQAFLQADQRRFRDIQVAHLLGYFHIIHHAHADERQLAIMLHGCIRHLLHSGDERCKCGDNDAAGCVAENLVQGWTDDALGRGPAGTFRVG